MKLIGFTCTYNEAEYIPYVMPYVKAMGYDKFIVYDNGSTDGTTEILKRRYPFVEVREYYTGGKFDDGVKCRLQSESFFECKELAKDGELICMTWTDFDEVLMWNGDVDIKKQLEEDYIWRGYNCFYKNMINVLPPNKKYITSDHFEYGGFVHAMPNMRGNVWVGGMKPTMYIVNDFASIDFYPGNHYAFLTPRDGVEIKNYDDTCRMYGFHLKFVDKGALIRKTKGYAERGLEAAKNLLGNIDEVYDKHLALSFPMENYFLQDFFSSKLSSVGTPYDGAIKKG